MRHAGTQEIETPRLILRRLLSEDANRMYVNWANDPDVTRFLRWEPHKNAAETRQLLEAWATLYPNEDYYQWAPSASITACWGSPSRKPRGPGWISPRAFGSRDTASAKRGGTKALPPKPSARL